MNGSPPVGWPVTCTLAETRKRPSRRNAAARSKPQLRHASAGACSSTRASVLRRRRRVNAAGSPAKAWSASTVRSSASGTGLFSWRAVLMTGQSEAAMRTGPPFDDPSPAARGSPVRRCTCKSLFAMRRRIARPSRLPRDARLPLPGVRAAGPRRDGGSSAALRDRGRRRRDRGPARVPARRGARRGDPRPARPHAARLAPARRARSRHRGARALGPGAAVAGGCADAHARVPGPGVGRGRFRRLALRGGRTACTRRLARAR